ncbi:MAG: ABC transporter permease [Chloroflexi bacterium]|nr:ABC transporter permease [Chloroflexota bacterium]
MKQRLILYLMTLWAVLTLNFLLPRMLPGDPLQALLDPQSSTYVFDPATRAALEADYGLDRSLLEQYAGYLVGVFTADLGHSIRLNQPVIDLIRSHLPWTLLLTGSALALASLVGIVIGTEAAWRHRSMWDTSLVTVSVILSNAPVFFTGMVFLIVFGVWLGWLPLSGGRTPFADYSSLLAEMRDYGSHLLLPLVTLTLSLLGGKFLLVRNSMLGVLQEDFMLVARAKGLPAGQLKRRHGLRNAILPFVHHLASHAGFAITGALFIETLFAYPGIGQLIFDSVVVRDYPVIQGVFLVVSLMVLSANLLADWLSYQLDPRLREA